MAYTTINKPSDYFRTKAYTGNGSTLTNTVGFQPDLTWCKARSYNDDLYLFDAIRGTGKYIISNQSASEGNNANTLTSLNSDGFTLVPDGGPNSNGSQYISWNWKANGAGVSNTDGSITSTVSANTTTGFSIVKYTGTGANATVGHGLGVAPKMVIIKNRSDGYDWIIYNQNIGNTGFLRLNTTAAYDTGINMFQNTDSTSSVFSISSHGAVNASGNNFIAYCFAEKTGFSKFDSYIGDGDADGQFIYTGFKPAFVMYKKSSASGNDWIMADRVRASAVNPLNKELYANLNGQEGTVNLLDFTSNGFKLRRTHTSQNENGAKYIYMCFAQAPLVGSNNVPCTAR